MILTAQTPSLLGTWVKYSCFAGAVSEYKMLGLSDPWRNTHLYNTVESSGSLGEGAGDVVSRLQVEL